MKKIHVCCGGVYLNGYVNIDKYPFELGDDSRSGCVADVLADVFELPYEKGSLSEIVLVHGMEHFTRYDGVLLLRKFVDLLAPDGVLYLEMPSRNPVIILTMIERIVTTILPKKVATSFGRGLASSMLWGNQWAGFDYETHRYLWSTNELLEVGRAEGLEFSKVFRYTASHVPFRDMGLALSRSNTVHNYSPPVIKRRALHGLFAYISAVVKGCGSVIKASINLAK
jgi:hypothetical protein